MDGDPAELLERRLGQCSTFSTRIDRARRPSARSNASARALEAAHSRLEMECLHTQHALLPVGLQVGAPDQAVTVEEREHVIPVDPLRLTFVDLDHVPEPEDTLDEGPVPEQVVERAEQHAAGRGLAVEHGVDRHDDRCAAVRDGHAPNEPVRGQAVDDRSHPAGAAREAAVLGDPRVGERAPALAPPSAHTRARTHPPTGSARRGTAAGSPARAGRTAAGTRRVRRRRPRRPRRGARARAWPASSSTSRRASAPGPRRRARGEPRARGSPRGRAPRSPGPSARGPTSAGRGGAPCAA